MKKEIVFILCLMFTTSCIKHPTTTFEEPQRVQELLNKVVDGDTTAYYEISVDYFLEDRGEEFLYYAIIMANKYNNPQAYNDVYTILTRFKNYNLKSLDYKTRNLALYYLVKSYELDPERIVELDIKDVFGEDSIPRSNYYLQKLSEID